MGGLIILGILLVLAGIAWWKGTHEHIGLAVGLILMAFPLWLMSGVNTIWMETPLGEFVGGAALLGVLCFSASCPGVLRGLRVWCIRRFTTRSQSADDDEHTKPVGTKAKIAAGVAAVAVFVTLFSCLRRGQEDHWHAGETREAIEVGRKYAWDLLWCRKRQLLEVSVSPARDRLESSNLEEVPVYLSFKEIWQHWGVSRQEYLDASRQYPHVLGPLVFTEESEAEGKNENLELLVLQKCDLILVMTFAYRDPERIIEIPGKGKMLFAVAMKYYRPGGAKTGRWVVYDYHYNGNLRDYYDWVLREGKEAWLAWLEKQQESEEFWKHVATEGWLEDLLQSAERSLDFEFHWGATRTIEQVKEVERLYEEFKETGKGADEIRK